MLAEEMTNILAYGVSLKVNLMAGMFFQPKSLEVAKVGDSGLKVQRYIGLHIYSQDPAWLSIMTSLACLHACCYTQYWMIRYELMMCCFHYLIEFL